MQGITDRRHLLDLTDRACTKRYILYMHKMNKRENVRAAVDLHCLGLTYPQLHAANAAQSSVAGAFAAAMSSLRAEPCQIPGPEAARHLVPETLAAQQASVEAASSSRGHESPSETITRRSARLRSAFGLAGRVAEISQSSSAGISQSSAAHVDCNCPAMNPLVRSFDCVGHQAELHRTRPVLHALGFISEQS